MSSSNDRKARLAALATRAGRRQPVNAAESGEDNDVTQGLPDHHSPSNEQPPQPEQPQKPIFHFRNYTPAAEIARLRSQEPASKRARPDAAGAVAPTVTKSALQHALDQAQHERLVTTTTTALHPLVDLDVTAVAPKKINWDLQRDIRGKLDKLERRTQKVIIELLKERLEREAVAAAEEDDEDDDDDDDDQLD